MRRCNKERTRPHCPYQRLSHCSLLLQRYAVSHIAAGAYNQDPSNPQASQRCSSSRTSRCEGWLLMAAMMTEKSCVHGQHSTQNNLVGKACRLVGEEPGETSV